MKRLVSTKDQLFHLSLLIASELDKHGKVMVEVKRSPKSLEQLGYLHAEVLPKLTIALFDAGEIKSKSEGACKYWLKRQIGYGTWYTFGKDEVVFDGDSFQRATIDTLIQAIDTGIDEAAKRGIFVSPPK